MNFCAKLCLTAQLRIYINTLTQILPGATTGFLLLLERPVSFIGPLPLSFFFYIKPPTLILTLTAEQLLCVRGAGLGWQLDGAAPRRAGLAQPRQELSLGNAGNHGYLHPAGF